MKIIHGNLIDYVEEGLFDAIVHGCNCFNAMGGGIAKEIKKRYPRAAEIDSETLKGDIGKLGNYTKMFGSQFNIINAYTQYGISCGQDVFEYDAFSLILKKLLHVYPGCRFGFPLIGQGLAMGNPNRINDILMNFDRSLVETGGSVTIVKFSKVHGIPD